VTTQSSAKRPAALQQIAARQPVAEQPVAGRPETKPEADQTKAQSPVTTQSSAERPRVLNIAATCGTATSD